MDINAAIMAAVIKPRIPVGKNFPRNIGSAYRLLIEASDPMRKWFSSGAFVIMYTNAQIPRKFGIINLAIKDSELNMYCFFTDSGLSIASALATAVGHIAQLTSPAVKHIHKTYFHPNVPELEKGFIPPSPI